MATTSKSKSTGAGKAPAQRSVREVIQAISAKSRAKRAAQEAGQPAQTGAPADARTVSTLLHPGFQIVQVPASWPCDIDEALVALEDAMGILDLLTEIDLKEPPMALKSVLLTTLSAVGKAQRSLIGEREVQS